MNPPPRVVAFASSLREGSFNRRLVRIAADGLEAAGAVVTRLDLRDYPLPLYDAEGRAYVTIGLGCTGGRHRSVALVEALAERLRKQGREVNVEHRDVEKGS